jgi:hypothetical protein
MLRSQHPDWAVAAHDMSRAYPQITRHQCLAVLARLAPAYYKGILQLLAHDPAAMGVFPEGNNVWLLENPEGVQAGCVLGALLFSLGAHPYFAKARDVLREKCPEGVTKAYIDDLLSQGTPEAVLEVVKYLKRNNHERGLFYSIAKLVVLLPEMGKERAHAVAQLFCDEGASHKNIKIHPNDVDDSHKSEADRRYGLVYLGAPIGSKAYQEDYFRSYMAELEEVAYNISCLLCTQSRLRLWRVCYAVKVMHLARALPALPGSPIKAFLDDFAELSHRLFFEGVIGVPMSDVPDSAQDQVHTTAGAKTPHMPTVAHSAYLAALARTIPIIRESCSDQLAQQLLDIVVGQAVQPGEPEAVQNVRAVLAQYEGQLRGSPNALQRGATLATLLYPARQSNDGDARPETAAVAQRRLSQPVKDYAEQRLIDSSDNETKARIWQSRFPTCGNRFVFVQQNVNPDSVYNLPSDQLRVMLMALFGIPFGAGQCRRAGGVFKAHRSGVLWGNRYLKCACGEEVDPEGQHFNFCACGSDLFRKSGNQFVHDAVVRELHNAGRNICRIDCAMEVTSGIEILLDGNGTWYKGFKDADIACYCKLPGFPPADYNGPPISAIASDVKIFNFTAYKGSDLAMDTTFYKKLTSRVEQRNIQNGFYFVPFVVGDKGGIHPESYALIEAMAAQGSQSSGYWHNRAKALERYLADRLSIAVSKAYAELMILAISATRRASAGGRSKSSVTGDAEGESPLMAFSWHKFQRSRPLVSV